MLAIAVPATAHAAATTYCVHTDACPTGGIPKDTVQDAADAAVSGDTILVGAGTFDGADLPAHVTLTGAGAGATTVRSLGLSSDTVTDLTVKPATTVENVVSATASTLERVVVDARGIGSPAITGTGLDVEHVAVLADGDGIRATGLANKIDHATIFSTGTGGDAISLDAATCGIGGAVAVHAVAIGGFGTQLRAAAPEESSCDPITITVSGSVYDTDLTVGDVQDADPPASSALGLLDAAGGDLRPRFDSPLVDAGGAVPAGTTDVRGLAGDVDGDADGTAASDIGAYEYQRAAPVAAATFSPPQGPAGTPFAFHGSAVDSIDGDAVTSYRWAFDDGALATGPSVSHAFATNGLHHAILTATDAAGVGSQIDVQVGNALPAQPSGAGTTELETAVQPAHGVAGITAFTPTRLTLKAKRVGKHSRRWRLTAKLALPAGADAAACTGGRVLFRVRVAGLQASTVKGKLDSTCQAKGTLRLLSGIPVRTVRVSAAFQGTDTLAAQVSKAIRLR